MSSEQHASSLAKSRLNTFTTDNYPGIYLCSQHISICVEKGVSEYSSSLLRRKLLVSLRTLYQAPRYLRLTRALQAMPITLSEQI